MKRTMMAAALLAAATSAPCLAAEDFQWQGAVARGAAVEIKGVNGGISATASSGSQVELTARKHARKSDPDEVEIAVVEHPGGVTICAVYPSRDGKPNECAPGGGGRMQVHDNDTQVEFEVKVPAGVRFIGRTVNGHVSARGIQADAEISTVNGGIEVDAAGTARARTVNGRITASLGRADWTGTLKFETVNGAIEVALPQGTNAEVKASTVNGRIETDFPLSVSGRWHRRLHGTLGSGGRTLEMSTVNGGIELARAEGALARRKS